MDKFGTAQTAARREDVRFLTGKGNYIDDTAPQGALFGYFLRSSVAHAEITALDVSSAREAPGVAGVFTAEEMEAGGADLHLPASLAPNRDGSKGANPFHPVLAKGRVRYVGEPIALIVAETLEQAKDAAELVEMDFDELPVHVAVAEGGAEIHPEAPGNVAFDWALGDEDATEAAFAAAAHHVRLTVEHNRIVVNPMEPRGCHATWDGERMHLAYSGQGVWQTKDLLVKLLGLKAEAVQVTTPDVGGGFGMKAQPHVEYFPIAFAARALGKPVRWMAERTEGMISDAAGRDLVSHAELAFDADHRITAYRVNILSNLGAYNSNFGQFIQSAVSSRVLTGVYDVQTVFVNAKGIYTNTAPTDAYRGAGRPEAIYTLERVMDAAARQMGVDPWVLHEKNFIREFPYKTAAGETYDVGDFPRVMGRVRAEADVAGFAARRKETEAAGKLRGLGLCYYIEAILGDPTEGATVEFREDGTVALYVGTQSNGQGHETVYAEFLAARTGIPADKIVVVQGDSDLIAHGGGTGGSRSVTTQSTATIEAVKVMVGAFVPFLEGELDAQGFEFDGDAFRAPGTNHAVTMIEAADMARAAGRADLLKHAAKGTLPGRSYPNGAHVAEVEVDPVTGVVEVVRYTVTDDFGTLMHPQLAEGQVHGGIAQGLGQAITENCVYDENGQILTATFMDYGMPRADDMPMIKFTTEPVPSTANVLGMKGCGEAGTVGALAAIANALTDALEPVGTKPAQMPFSPARVWQLMKEAGRIAAE